MTAFHFHLLFLWIFAGSCRGSDEWMKCKPSPGCSIARCDPKPFRLFELSGEIDEYSILCQKEDMAPPVAPGPDNQMIEELRDEIIELKGRMNQLEATNLNLVREVNEIKASVAENDVNRNIPILLQPQTIQPPTLSSGNRNTPAPRPLSRQPSAWSSGTLRASNGNQYKHFREKTNYQEAQRRCHSIGGRLASTGIRSSVVRNELRRNLFPTNEAQSWIGLKLSGRQWRWSDRGRYSSGSTPWARHRNGVREPNGSGECARIFLLDGRLALGDSRCNDVNTYLCER